VDPSSGGALEFKDDYGGMTSPLSESKPMGLAVNVFTVPVSYAKADMHALLPALDNFGFESYQPTSDPGAILSCPGGTPRLTINGISRQVVVPVPAWKRAADTAYQILEAVKVRLPVENYVAAQVVCTTHYPVAGQTATTLLRTRFFDDNAFDELGPQYTGTGLKIFLSRELGSVSIEPLLANDAMLYVQTARTHPAPISFSLLKTFIDDVVRFSDENVRLFLDKLFG
jgi:hypothetical protein